MSEATIVVCPDDVIGRIYGPILNARFCVKRIMPHMHPVMRVLRQHGIDVIWTDCDGNTLKVMPRQVPYSQAPCAHQTVCNPWYILRPGCHRHPLNYAHRPPPRRKRLWL